MKTPNVIPQDFEPPKEDKFPFPAPFILSSVERYWCMNDSAKIVFIKRRHLEENLKVIEAEIGMDETERGKFLDWWCSPGQSDASEIRAEGDRYFNLRQRADNWMKKPTRTKQQQPSRIQQYAESARQFLTRQQQDVSFPGAGSPAGGYANIPDEQ